MDKKQRETSWGGVANWYDEYLGGEDTYQKQVILPNLLRVLQIKKGERILDLACGQGFFAREFSNAGAAVTAVDISKELVEQAKEIDKKSTAKNSYPISYFIAPADKLAFAKEHIYDSVVCVLAIQNIENMLGVFKEMKRVLKPGGRFIIVLNHPAFRVLKNSSWGWDEENNIQYRRVDGYLSQAKINVDMAPGKGSTKKTISYHRSLQDFYKAFRSAGFAVSGLEEWISHKTSERGPRQKAEDTARKEIPLFMMLEAK